MRALRSILVSTAILLSASWVFAVDGEALSAERIVGKAAHAAYYQGKDVRLRASMTIKDRRGREKQRTFVVLRRNEEGGSDGDQKYFVYFEEPQDVRRMVFMVWKRTDANDDRWLYLPALDLVQRIAASRKRTSFAGSHFFYEDISGRSTFLDEHELVETTDKYYVVKSTPRQKGEAEFSSYKAWIHKGSFVAVRIEYYDAVGETHRTYEAIRVVDVQGYRTVMEARMKDLKKNGETVLRYEKVEYDVGLPESVFTERYLRMAPTEFLKW